MWEILLDKEFMSININASRALRLNRDRWAPLWLVIPAGLAFFGSLGIFIFSSFYDREIAIYFGNFFHHRFGNFLAHWANYTGNKMIFLAVVPASVIVIETYLVKAKSYQSNGFVAKNGWLLWLIYGLFFSGFLGINITELLRQRFADKGWGPGILPNYLETYEKGLIYKSVFATINFIFYGSFIYWAHFYLAKNQVLIENDYWVSALKVIMFAILIYAIVGITKLAFGRPYYFSNIFEYNQFKELNPTGKTILEEMQEAGFGPPSSNKMPYLQLPYTEWWEPFRPFPYQHQLFALNFNPYLFNVDFPSGHMASAAILLSAIFFGLDHAKKRSTSGLTIVFSYLMFVQILFVYFGMVIYRFHWLSDMAFTMMLDIIFIYFVQIKINFWYQAGVLDKYLPLLTKNDKINIVDYKTN